MRRSLLHVRSGDAGSLSAFVGFFANVPLCKGTQIICLWTKSGNLDVVVLDAAAAATADLRTMAPQHRVASEGFARALFELFLGEGSVVSAAKPVWAAGARALLESEQVKRESR